MIVKSENFSVISAQLAVISNKDESISPAMILGKTYVEYSSRFDADPQSIPLPSDAPPEIPRVILTSKDGQYRLTSSANRIDSFWNRTASPKELGQIVPLLAEPLEQLLLKTELSIGRIALLVTRLVKRDKAAEFLAKKFCNEWALSDPIRRSDTFEIHNHKKFNLVLNKNSLLAVNSWVRCKTGQSTSGSETAIVVEQDINSLNEELPSRKFSAQDFKYFHEAAVLELENIMSLYFSGQVVK